MNNYLAPEINKLLDQGTKISKKISICNEVQELEKKFSGTLISYNQTPFQINSVFQGPHEIVFKGNLWSGGVWEPYETTHSDPQFQFMSYPSRFLNTKDGLYSVDRVLKKQWKWGINSNNTIIRKILDIMTFNNGKVQFKVLNIGDNIPVPLLNSIFKFEYPSISLIKEKRKSFVVKNGIALNENLVLFKKEDEYKILYEDCVVATNKTLSGSFKLNSNYVYLKETLDDCGIKSRG